MRILSISIAGWLSAVLFLGQHIKAQECEDDQSTFTFPRVFMAMFKGPPPQISNRTSFAKSLGSCLSVEDMNEQMMAYFEPYSFDNMSSVREDPFRVHEDPRFVLFPINQNTGVYRLLLEVFYEYAKIGGTPLEFVSWILQAKTNVPGPKGTLQAGDWAAYCMIRLKIDGHDFCIQCNDDGPVPWYKGENATLPFVLALYHEYWGRGVARGLSVFTNNGPDKEPDIEQRYIMTFPAEI